MTLQERLRQMAAFHEADTGCPTGARHLAWAAESREAADRIAELEALLRRIDNVITWETTPLGRQFQEELEAALRR